MSQHIDPVSLACGDPQWRKSSRSTDEGACVELASIPAAVAVRDSKDPGGPKLAFRGRNWREFAAGVKAGRYDL